MPRNTEQTRLCAIVLLGALLKPSGAKRVIMAARMLQLLSEAEVELAIAGLGLDHD